MARNRGTSTTYTSGSGDLCHNCHQHAGTRYTIYVGMPRGTGTIPADPLSNVALRTTLYDTTTRSVPICDDCVARFTKARVRRLIIGGFFGALLCFAFGSCLLSGMFITPAPGQEDPWPVFLILGLIFIASAVILAIWIRHSVRTERPALMQSLAGEKLAMRVLGKELAGQNAMLWNSAGYAARQRSSAAAEQEFQREQERWRRSRL